MSEDFENHLASQWIDGADICIALEVDYIVRKALNHEARVVTMGSFVLFSMRPVMPG